MTDYLTLTEFVPGTKAKAQEVNANFTTLRDALSEKASMEGDSTKTFNVANATLNTHAVNKTQLNDLSSSLIVEINKMLTRFCVKSGNVTGGKGDLFSYSGLVITAKVGGAYPNLIFSNYKGEFTTITSLSTVNMTGKANGSYNIFIKSDGTLYTLANNIYTQPYRPTLVEGDVWLDTSIEPINAIKYASATDTEFLDVPLGKVVIASSTISSIETFPYNQNGYEVNKKTLGALTKCWVSDEYTPVKGTETAVTHNLNLTDPKKVFGDILLVCKTAEFGYAVGETAQWLNGTGYSYGAGVQPRIDANTIKFKTGIQNNGLLIINKTTGDCSDITLANWRYIFRIWY